MSGRDYTALSSRITPDQAAAQCFLSWLDPDAEGFTFQTFDDNKDRKDPRLARVRHGSLEDRWRELCALSAQGAGVFVTINETDGRGRTAEHVTRVCALFADLDGAPIPDPWPIHPSGLVDSSPGRSHAYWLVGDCPHGRFKELQTRIAAKLGSDSSVIDLSRVLRLPGFPHQKGAPVMVCAKLLEDPLLFTHSLADIEKAFPPVLNGKTTVRTKAQDTIVMALEATGCGPIVLSNPEMSLKGG